MAMAKRKDADGRRAAKVRFYALCVLVVAVLILFNRIRTRVPLPPVKDPFQDFTVLPVPRRDISIGASWVQGIGPTSQGLAAGLQLAAQSLDSSVVQQSTVISGSVAALASALRLSSSVSARQQSTIQLRKLSIVRVADAATLNLEAEHSYVWEGIRADEFVASLSENEENDLRAALHGLKSSATIKEEQTGTNSRSITVEGVDLFVAFRLVTVKLEAPKSLATQKIESPVSQVGLGSEYSIKFSNVPERRASTDPRCKVVMEAASFETREWKSKPTTINCHAETLEFELRSAHTGFTITRDYLKIADFHAYPEEDSVGVIGDFSVARHQLQLVALGNPQASGWT